MTMIAQPTESNGDRLSDSANFWPELSTGEFRAMYGVVQGEDARVAHWLMLSAAHVNKELSSIIETATLNNQNTLAEAMPETMHITQAGVEQNLNVATIKYKAAVYSRGAWLAQNALAGYDTTRVGRRDEQRSDVLDTGNKYLQESIQAIASLLEQSAWRFELI